MLAQSTHFAPVTLPTEITAEDYLMNDASVFHRSSRQNAIDITHDIDQLVSVRASAQVAELPNKIKRFELKQNQNTLYNSFSDWAGTINT